MNKEKLNNVLVLGYRKGLAKKIVERGLRPIFFVTKYKKGIEDYRYFVVSNLEDAQEVLRAIYSLVDEPLSGVVTGHEEEVFTSALIRSILQLPGPKNYNDLLRFRDKKIQKSTLTGIVPCARVCYVSSRITLTEMINNVGLPFIIKPSNGAGSKKTRIIHNVSDFERFVSEIGALTDFEYVVESLIKGVEYYVDGIWSGSKLTWFTISKYNTNLIDFNDGKTVAVQIISKLEFPTLYIGVEKLVTTIMFSLTKESMIFHLEFFDTGTDLVFSECAARIAGGLIPEIIGYSYGIDWFSVQIDCCLAQMQDYSFPNVPYECYAFVFLRKNKGIDQSEDDYIKIFDPVKVEFSNLPSNKQTGSYGNSGYIIVSDKNNILLDKKVAAIVEYNETGRINEQ